jgi:hypothetical protein
MVMRLSRSWYVFIIYIYIYRFLVCDWNSQFNLEQDFNYFVCLKSLFSSCGFGIFFFML